MNQMPDRLRLVIDTTKDMISVESMMEHRKLTDDDGLIYREILNDTLELLEVLLIVDETDDKENE